MYGVFAAFIFRIIFAGNLGRFQGLEDIVGATSLLGPLANFELVFLGEGKALSSLQSLAEKSPEGMIKLLIILVDTLSWYC